MEKEDEIANGIGQVAVRSTCPEAAASSSASLVPSRKPILSNKLLFSSTESLSLRLDHAKSMPLGIFFFNLG